MKIILEIMAPAPISLMGKCIWEAAMAAVKAKLGRIMVIEGDERLQRQYRHALRHNYEMSVVPAGEGIIETLEHYDPDVVLLDCDLPEPYPLKICQKIRSHNLCADRYTGIVLMATQGDSELLSQYCKAGADSICMKGFVATQLEPIVNSIHRLGAMTEELKHSSDKLKTHNARLQRLSITDELTGLYNMRHVKQSLDKEFLAAKKGQYAFAILMIDIDHFKQVNDGADHLLGSYVIGQLGREISHVTRAADIPGRYGGDEFIVLLPHTDDEGALVVAQRLKERIRHKVYSNGYDATSITISQGLAVMDGSSPGEETAEELLRRADKALYQAKANGRNAIVISPAHADQDNPSDESKVAG